MTIETPTLTWAEHSWGCHPEDTVAPADAPIYAPEPEPCWHCATTTTLGCRCERCRDTTDTVGPVYHCTTCGRWWAYFDVVHIDLGVGSA